MVQYNWTCLWSENCSYYGLSCIFWWEDPLLPWADVFFQWRKWKDLLCTQLFCLARSVLSFECSLSSFFCTFAINCSSSKVPATSAQLWKWKFKQAVEGGLHDLLRHVWRCSIVRNEFAHGGCKHPTGYFGLFKTNFSSSWYIKRSQMFWLCNRNDKYEFCYEILVGIYWDIPGEILLQTLC